MERFDEIMANIQKELLELKEINQSLQKENASLREQLGMPVRTVSNGNDNLSLSEAFAAFNLADSYDEKALSNKTRAYKSFTYAGYSNIGQFKGKSIYDLLNVPNVGVASCAILIVLLEHFGVQIELPDLGCIRKSYMNKIRKIREELPKIRENCTFTK